MGTTALVLPMFWPQFAGAPPLAGYEEVHLGQRSSPAQGEAVQAQVAAAQAAKGTSESPSQVHTEPPPARARARSLLWVP